MSYVFSHQRPGVYQLSQPHFHADGLIEGAFRLLIHTKGGTTGARVMTESISSKRLIAAIDDGYFVYACTFTPGHFSISGIHKFYTPKQVRGLWHFRDTDLDTPLQHRDDLLAAANRAIEAFIAKRRTAQASGVCTRCYGKRAFAEYGHIHGGVCYGCGGTGKA